MVSKTVLVVEDNEMNMKLARDLLGQLGCRILEATDAEAGLMLLEETDPDLVLMDLHLPGMDGLEACRIIRGKMGRKDLPIVALTALAMDGDEEAALEAGCNDYITKPIDVGIFLDTVGWFLSADRRLTGINLSSRDGAKKKVLVVDDNPSNVKLIKTMLPQDVYNVLEAYNGENALKIARTELPDVIFLDIMMPDLDGYEVTRLLKSDEETRDVPVVLVTALDGTEDRIKGLEAGAEDVLIKPVNRIEVLARTRSMVLLAQYQREVAVREQAAQTFLKGGRITRKPRSGYAEILVVEDCEQDMELMLSCLDQNSCKIHKAYTAQEAERVISGHALDLVLLDILLPDGNGFEILDSLKRTRRNKNIQVAVVTALDDIDNRLRGIELGSDDYIVKPFHPRELQARVKVLRKKKEYLDRLMEGHEAEPGSTARDELTGLHNRSYLDGFLDLEIKKSLRYGHPVSLAIVDIDGFAAYENSFGNKMADLVVRELAEILRKVFREVDMMVRFGRDEFAIVLPYCGPTEHMKIARRVSEAVRDHSFPGEKGFPAGKMRVSTGMAAYPGHVDTSAGMIDLAEKNVVKIRRKRGRGDGGPFRREAAR